VLPTCAAADVVAVIIIIIIIMEEMLSIVHNTGRKLTAASRPIRNGDEYRTRKSQRAMLTGGHLYLFMYDNIAHKNLLTW